MPISTGIDVLDRNRPHCLIQTPVGEDGREDAVGELAHLFVRGFRVRERLVHQRGRILSIPLELAACELQRHDRVHEARLRPVVQVTHHPAALLVGSGHDPSSGGGEI